MLRKYAAGKLPPDVIPEENYLAAKRANVEPDPQGLATAWELAREQFCANFGEYAFSRGIEAVWSVLAKVDKMISDAKPWELAKQPESSAILQAVLYRAAESLRWAAVLLFPVMPEAARTIYQQLGISGAVDSINPRRLKWGELAPGLMTGQAQALFPRLDRQKIMAEIESEAATNEPAARPDEAVPEPAYITIEDFAKVELKVGQVLRAERVPKADKLLVLQVDAGESEPRQILAGIAQYYEPESLVGRKLVIVANLAPRKLRGLESQGMVVAASFGEEGRPVVATFLEEVPNGARLK
jgi:methionyl-tRNA synthetase